MSDITQPKGKILAVASGKGGVGKTWFAVTLAHALSMQGKKVLLFDGDLGLANVDVQLGLMPKHDLNAVLDGRLKLKQTVTRFDEGGYDIIAGQSGTSSLSVLPKEKLLDLKGQITDLATDYDFVILDLGAGIDRTVRILSSAADKMLVVTNEEPTALTDAYAFIKLTYLSGLSERVNVVVNLVEKDKDGERIYTTLAKACENFLKFRPPLAGMIHRDSHVVDSIRSQRPILIRFPNCSAATDVVKMAEALYKNKDKDKV